MGYESRIVQSGTVIRFRKHQASRTPKPPNGKHEKGEGYECEQGGISNAFGLEFPFESGTIVDPRRG